MVNGDRLNLKLGGNMSRSTELLTTYISDSLALEKHLFEAFDRQSNDSKVADHSQAKPLIEQLRHASRGHIQQLEPHLRALGGHATSVVKEAITTALGLAAGIVDKVRPFTVSKMLRDDYTALSMAAISYTMLHSTALALRDTSTAELARKHLEDWTPLIVQLSEVIPFVVIRELEQDSLPIDGNAAAEALKNTHHAWSRDTVEKAA
jgi:ferritin-like metal-binding protein YciE